MTPEDELDEPLMLAGTVQDERKQTAFKKRIYELQKMKRGNIMMHAALTFLFQCLLVIMVFSQLFTQKSYYCVLT